MKKCCLRAFSACFFLLSAVLILTSKAVFAADLPTDGIYRICSALDARFVLDERHDSGEAEADASLQMFRPLSVKQQEFCLTFVSHRCFRITNLYSGKCLAEGEHTAMEAPASAPVKTDEFITASVLLTDLPDGDLPLADDPSVWRLVSRPDGSFLLESSGGLYLSLSEGRAYNNAGVFLSSFTGRIDQHWSFEPSPVFSDGTADTAAVNPYEEYGRLYGMKVRIAFQDRQETLTSDQLAAWMVPTENHTYETDEEKLRSYVSSLAEKYNTVGSIRTFETSYQTPITLYEGTFGWKLNEDETAAVLKEAILVPGNHLIEPVWSKKGKEFYGKNSDIGDSYVEVDLTAQKVWLYKDGKKLLETDCVSGTEGTSRKTPGGVYAIFYKQSPAVLTGPDYASPVDYWMPFNGGVGLHDATWRSSFGGEIYKTNGSHGCINLPWEAAKTIYETVEIGYPVVCYR